MKHINGLDCYLYGEGLMIISCGYGIHLMEICLKVGNVYWWYDDQLKGIWINVNMTLLVWISNIHIYGHKKVIKDVTSNKQGSLCDIIIVINIYWMIIHLILGPKSRTSDAH